MQSILGTTLRTKPGLLCGPNLGLLPVFWAKPQAAALTRTNCRTKFWKKGKLMDVIQTRLASTSASNTVHSYAQFGIKS